MAEPNKPISGKRIAVRVVFGMLGFLTVTIAILVPKVIDDVSRLAKRAGLINEISRVQTAIVAYYTEYSIYPTTTDNATLIKILNGATATSENSRQIRFLTEKPSELNARGELVDPWGTPFQISVDSKGILHIHSAGPDQIFNTPDDTINDIGPDDFPTVK